MAKMDLDSMHPAILRGVAPAMHCSWKTTCWGQQTNETIDESKAKLLGARHQTPQHIQTIFEDAWRRANNARQCMSEFKGVFAGGGRRVLSCSTFVVPSVSLFLPHHPSPFLSFLPSFPSFLLLAFPRFLLLLFFGSDSSGKPRRVPN